MLRLYYHPLSTFSQRVRIALLEKQVPADLVEVDLFSKAQFRPEYLSKNPYGRVPTIEEDGLVLSESTAILEYLEATRPHPPPVPADVRSRAVLAMHIKLCDLEFAELSRAILIPKRFLPKERWRTDVMKEAKARIDRTSASWRRRWRGRTTWSVTSSAWWRCVTRRSCSFLPLLRWSQDEQRLRGLREFLRARVRETRPAR